MVEYRFATQKQKEIAEEARRILEKELRPRIAELEHANDGRGEFPLDVMRTLGAAGYCGLDVPEKWGGLGLDLVTQCLIYEEMSKVDVGFAFNLYCAAGSKFGFIEKSHIPDDDKQRWADRMLAGEVVGGFCLTEAQAGSDAANIKTTAVYDEQAEEWVINGNKMFVTNGPLADFFVVFAVTDKDASTSKKMTAFLVEKERGPKVGSIENKMGLKLSVTSEIIFEDVRVPKDHVIGEVGQGWGVSMSELNPSRITTMAFPLGVAQVALDYAAAYANTRVAFGKPIIKNQGLAFMLADMQIRIDASRAMVYEGARCIMEGRDIGTLSATVKAFVAESTVQTTMDAIQVFGGYGYTKDYPVEKLARDAKIFCIFDGTTQVQKHILGKMLEKKYKQ